MVGSVELVVVSARVDGADAGEVTSSREEAAVGRGSGEGEGANRGEGEEKKRALTRLGRGGREKQVEGKVRCVERNKTGEGKRDDEEADGSSRTALRSERGRDVMVGGLRRAQSPMNSFENELGEAKSEPRSKRKGGR